MTKTLNTINVQETDPLQRKLNTLELEWDSIKQTISRSNREKPIVATCDDDNNINNSLFQICNSSPKELMSMLQCEFDKSSIKGRRLFEESDKDSPSPGNLNGEKPRLFEGSDMDEKSVVSSESSCQVLDKCDLVGPDVVVLAVKGSCGLGVGGVWVGRWVIWVVVMMFAIGIVAFKCSGQDEQILVPT
ncbi:hypothetical protein Tco_0374353 [Tanacetum coccineum]